MSFASAMIACNDLSKIYRTNLGEVRGLDGLSLEIQKGDFVCVRGPSGCGKTTLLLALGGMLRPTRGTVRVDGDDIYALPSRHRADFRAKKLGFVFQMFHLLPYLGVLDNILLAANGKQGHDHKQRASELIEQLGLTQRQHHTPAQLSAGERQRAALARALLNRPEIILADEPTGNLDPENAREVFLHLKSFQQSGGTVVVVTHGATAEDYASRVIEMRAGKLAG